MSSWRSTVSPAARMAKIVSPCRTSRSATRMWKFSRARRPERLFIGAMRCRKLKIRSSRMQPPADWGAWADEYWTVYPDATAVRRQVLWTDHPGRESREFQESIVIIPAGESPEDNLHLDALTLANLNGESRTYTWPARTATGCAKPRGVEKFEGLEAPMIQWINLRSQWKPFQVAGGGPARFEGINWEPSMSAFEWWNHWPVAQIRSSGRPALTSDRPSHTSLSHIYWPVASQDAQHMTRLLLTGLTLDRAEQIAPRARAWLVFPSARVFGAAVVCFVFGVR